MIPAPLVEAGTALVLGGALGAGILLVLLVLPRWAAPSLQRRIAPYIRDIADPQGLTPLSPARSTPLWARVQERLTVLVGGTDGVMVRLRQAGRRADQAGVSAFRGRQLAWTLVGLLAGGVLAIILALAGRLSPAGAALPLIGALVAAVGYDVQLTRAARARAVRIQEELPTVLEFLALCLSAGEGVLDALRRVSVVGSGELTDQIGATVVAVGTGAPLPEALAEMSAALRLPSLTRAVDHIVAALDRGAPLAQVLQAQAADAREDAKRGLIEQAGRKEILMLLPVVFLILPLSVLFAIYPGIFMLRLGF